MQAVYSKTITQLQNRSSDYLSTRVVVTTIKVASPSVYAFEKSKPLKYHEFTMGFSLTSTTFRRSHLSQTHGYIKRE